MIGGKKWTEKDLEDLFQILKKLKNALFVLSIDKKEYFNDKDYFYKTIIRQNCVSNAKKRTKTKEYIIRNFDNSIIPLMKPINQKTLDKFTF